MQTAQLKPRTKYLDNYTEKQRLMKKIGKKRTFIVKSQNLHQFTVKLLTNFNNRHAILQCQCNQSGSKKIIEVLFW